MNYELKRIAGKIANFNPKDWEGTHTTKESLQNMYDSLKDIPDTMCIHEMWLIWYLRETKIGEANRFYRLAKQNYETHWKIINLRTPQLDDNDYPL